MANFYRPSQRVEDQRFDYTVESDETKGSTRAVGYCSGWTHDDPLPEGSTIPQEYWAQARDEALPFKEKFHTDGHATQDEAIRCYYRYVADLRRKPYDDPKTKIQCAVCAEWTHHQVMVGNAWHFHVCEKHDSPDELFALMVKELENRERVAD